MGKYGQGIGSPHTGWNYVWPMSIIMFALTSHDEDEIYRCLQTIVKSYGGTGFIHESFHKESAENYTRAWFGWANSLLGELIYKLYCQHPTVLKKLQ